VDYQIWGVAVNLYIYNLVFNTLRGGEFMKPSARFTFNKADFLNWGKNTLIFLGPALLVLLASFQSAVPSDYKYGALILFVLNIATDFLRKFVAGK
jgi:hypothetical protein